MGWMWVWWVFMGVAVAALVWMAVSSWRRGGAGEAGQGESPEQILKRRYASGEIDRDSFERMLEDLRR